jgi:hypothetical protein
MLNDGTEYEVPEKDIAMWVELYPAVSVQQELNGIKGWLHSNPKKRKTKRGISRFINSWLQRAQDKGGRSPLAKSNATLSTRDMSPRDEICDISWVKPEQKSFVREYFMQKYGHVFEG